MTGSPRRASSRLTSAAMSWPRDKTQVRHLIRARAAERHGQECGLLRHLAIHVDIVGIWCQKRIGQNLTVEKLGGGSDRRSAA